MIIKFIILVAIDLMAYILAEPIFNSIENTHVQFSFAIILSSLLTLANILLYNYMKE